MCWWPGPAPPGPAPRSCSRAGLGVDLIDIQPAVTAIGSGITLRGNALRVLCQLGVREQVRRPGYPFDTLGLRAPDGTLIAEFDDADRRP